ncbi:hypothetical protein [Microbacterium oleivorans]|uniref:hypothetical protein n=1 Tax=Microbacterium oleivorans TaxID=273677 RepID=UPI00080DA333|nr:hypothetical protein [Microbacterium oleivorans]
MTGSELRFRLPGRWFSVDLSTGAETSASIAAIARDAVGVTDDRATERATVRRQLHEAVAAGASGDIRALMLAHEITPGTPLPVTLLVFEPSDLRMSPAIGTEPRTVLGVLREALARLDPDARDSLVEVDGPGVPALRTHRVDDVPEDDDLHGTRRLSADYWVPVPETKQLLVVRLATPLGDIENLMLSLFDGFVAAAFFAAPRPSALREALRR